MSTKAKAWSIYIAIWGIVWIYYCHSGMSQYKSVAFNGGAALVWPLSIWKHDRRTPRDITLAGVADSCNIVNDPNVQAYCSCLTHGLDEAVPTSTAPEMVVGLVAVETARLAPICKVKTAPAQNPSAETPPAQQQSTVTPTPEGTAPSSSGDSEPIKSASPTTTQDQANKVLTAAADQGEQTAKEKWSKIKQDPAKFLSDCQTSETNSTVNLGGMAPVEAKKQADSTCSAELVALNKCMGSPSDDKYKTSQCFTSVFEHGD